LSCGTRTRRLPFDLVLRSRRAFATGRVVKIDTSSDAPYTPTIEFRDASGRAWTFDSNLQINGTTKTIGAEVAIMYDPANPKRAREVGRPFAKALNNVIWCATIVVLFASAFLVK
jgi:hypothetical protein